MPNPSSGSGFASQVQHITHVLLVRDHNDFHQGLTHNGISQAAIVDLYWYPLIEELEMEGIRYDILPTIVDRDERAKRVDQYAMVLMLRGGWNEKPIRLSKNVSQVHFSMPNSRQLADELADAIGQWGHCWVHGHKTGNPRFCEDEPLLQVPETKAVAIEPFLANGPDVDQYMRRMRELGVVIGRSVAEHLKARGQASTHKPFTVGAGAI